MRSAKQGSWPPGANGFDTTARHCVMEPPLIGIEVSVWRRIRPATLHPRLDLALKPSIYHCRVSRARLQAFCNSDGWWIGSRCARLDPAEIRRCLMNASSRSWPLHTCFPSLECKATPPAILLTGDATAQSHPPPDGSHASPVSGGGIAAASESMYEARYSHTVVNGKTSPCFHPHAVCTSSSWGRRGGAYIWRL